MTFYKYFILFVYMDNVETTEIKYEDTVPFIPPITGGKVIKVYDGDTITIASKLPYDDSLLYRFSIRIFGIDTPELRTSNEVEKEIAIKARDFVIEKIYGKNVELKNIATEKYGRVLAEVVSEDFSIGDLLVKEKLAVSYDGNKKNVPSCWKEYYESNQSS